MAAKKEEATAPKKIKVTLDSAIWGSEPIFIAVNGRRILVQTDTEVFLDREFYEVLINSRQAGREAKEYIERNKMRI